ncbi:hypothetical protein LY28_01233 [Ruminiclostridium sufflavum DSM 19573]|uniref:Uncharacterized protein n=1 Tax=Ruminiclostridium sufflavum DSM 19573 TaxID=1121337 RepID=A0A318XR97_9FIRM|nr:hypothetical protein [Ruminiclostridium sufflavum]PYG88869.1 hypothetical protein LY28_01233 [Ruminiclostridium sufflavum DSM 19573]
MSVSISLWSAIEGEIQRFLSSYYQMDIQKEEQCQNWISDFFNPLESIDMISALMDNFYKYKLTMYIHMENGYLHKITEENYNDVIKGLFEIYYLSA